MRKTTSFLLSLTALYGFLSGFGTLGSNQQPTETLIPNPYNSISALITILGSALLVPGVIGLLKEKSWAFPASISGLILFIIAAILIAIGGNILLLSYVLPIVSFVFLIFINKK